MRLIQLFCLCSIAFASAYAPLHAKIRGRVDVGPILMDIDILESGKTTKTLHMKGIKGDASLLLYQGLCIKPGIIWGEGHGQLAAGSIAVGYYLPITQTLKVLPNVGITWSHLHTRVDLSHFGLFDLKETFRSNSPFIGLELAYTFGEKWTLMAVYQYAWSRTHTKIGHVVSEKSHSCGPNYLLGIDYSLTPNWSLTLGAGYNITLSKEKHGLRGKGIKIGAAYYF